VSAIKILSALTAAGMLTLCASIVASRNSSGAPDTGQATGVEGTRDRAAVEVGTFLLPPSGFASREASSVLADLLKSNTARNGEPSPASIEQRREELEKDMQPRLEAARSLYAVKIDSARIGGVSVNVLEPIREVTARNRKRVLIELAGGAFTTATPAGGMLESLPVAGLGGFRVVSVHYRQGPEYRFPAATEDVVAVYAELLKHYRHSAIGIYGWSSGAYLTAMSLAWFQQHHLPRPGAVALLCGSAGRIFEGDSFFSGPAFTGHTPPQEVTAEHPIVQVEYMRDVKATDPLAMPINFPDVLAKFPPTLLIKGTPDVALSSEAYLQTRLVALGVEADLHVWDGMWHGFTNYPTLPEAREAMTVVAKFFDKELAK
jgi:epsilon-lactone hydrolase